MQNKELFQFKYPDVRYTDDDLEALAKGHLQYWKSSYKIKGDEEKLAKKWGREDSNRRDQRKRLVSTYLGNISTRTDALVGKEPPLEGGTKVPEEVPGCSGPHSPRPDSLDDGRKQRIQ